jgi:hypothetical protein
MTFQAIADDLGWKSTDTARNHEEALSYHGSNLSWADAYRLARLSEDAATAASVIAEVNERAISTTVETRRPEIKAIAAKIAGLPAAEKESTARDLANDREFMASLRRVENEQIEANRERAAQKKAADPVGRKFDARISLHQLQLVVNTAIQTVRGLLPEIGTVPKSESMWLTMQAEGLEDIAAELRHMAEYGETRIDTEIKAVS